MKRFMIFVLAFVMILGFVPVTSHAADTKDMTDLPDSGITEVEQVMFPAETYSSETDEGLGMRELEDGESYEEMTVSQGIVDLIKDFEGYRATPYADNTQWTVGYGSWCGDISDPRPDIYLTEPEAEARLRRDLARTYEPIVNEFCEDIGRQPSQQQFDALVDFTYNLGGAWTRGCRLATWLENPTTEMELVGAMGAWSRVGTDINYTIANRRIREALVFLHGEYYLAYGGGVFETELEVVDNDDLPYYKFTIYRANGGSFSSGKDYSLAFYKVGTRYGEFPAVSNSGENLKGWKITHVNNERLDEYEVIGPSSVVKNNLVVRAYWGEGSFPLPEPEPIDPEPTEPEPTEPEPTEPEPTEPEPTEPEDPDALPFEDVAEGTWFHDAVKYVYENGYMNGISDIAFAPDAFMTRGMLVTVLHRMEGESAVAEEIKSGFEDISGAYYENAVNWAYANGIVNGVTDQTFEPERVVTRQEAVAIFYRYCVEYKKMEVESVADLSVFADVDQVAGYALDAFAWSVEAGLVQGMDGVGGMNLCPMGTLTRAQAATLLMRCMEEILK